MKYVGLNNLNKSRMKSEIKNDLNFDWEDSYLMNELTKDLSLLYPNSSDSDEFINDNYFLSNINDLIRSLSKRYISNDIFLYKINKLLDELIVKFPYLKYRYDFNFDRYKTIIEYSNRLVLYGPGGIGKSYFIYKLEERLTELKVPHLCIYGKFNKNISKDVFDELKLIKKDFYLVIDALNEFEETEQNFILQELEKFNSCKNINIFITYRSYSLTNTIEDMLNNFTENFYEFKGVKFESSLLTMIETYGVEAVKYIDVIESNNPYQILMLKNILSSPKIKNEDIGSIVQITFILERYIKRICTLEDWKIIKKIGIYMFENEVSHIPENILKSICKEAFDDFVNKMLQNNLMTFYNTDTNVYFLFAIQSMSDYIISRSLLSNLKDLNDSEIIELINLKLSKMYNLSNIFALGLFDKYKDNDLEKVFYLIYNSDIKNEFDFSILNKVSFNIDQINYIQSIYENLDTKELFKNFAGFNNRPFNCSNYLNSILFSDFNLQSNLISYYDKGYYILRLKTILYSLPFFSNDDNLDEYFYFSFWLMSSSFSNLRFLAIKTIYDICMKDKNYSYVLMSFFSKIDDYYIKKGIIHVLTNLPENNDLTNFVNDIYNNFNVIDGEIIYRCSLYLKKVNCYFDLKKLNLNEKIPFDIEIDNDLDIKGLMSLADLYEKHVLKFDRYPNDYISISPNFILNSKDEVFNYNKKLNEIFTCVKENGNCKYSIGGSRFNKMVKDIEIKIIDGFRLLILYQEVFKFICSKYQYDYIERKDLNYYSFADSKLKKMLIISQDILLGSLMSNYYTDSFSVYNDEINFGYLFYEFSSYDEEEFHLNHPITPYNELVDKLNNKVYENIELFKKFNYKWFISKNNSIIKCQNMTKPLIINNTSWSLISGSIQLFIPDFVNVSYSCFLTIDPDKRLIGDTNSRFLTILEDTFYGNVDDYRKCYSNKSMSIKDFSFNSAEIKDSCLSFPQPFLVDELNLHFNFQTSSWDDIDGNQIILCDNNSKSYYKYPLTGAIYIKTEYLDIIKKNHKVFYWCYTEKLLSKYGWNENASLHLELDKDGNIIKEFNNNELSQIKDEVNPLCYNCPYDIIRKNNKIVDSFIDKL